MILRLLQRSAAALVVTAAEGVAWALHLGSSVWEDVEHDWRE